jgi:hypothetical protein
MFLAFAHADISAAQAGLMGLILPTVCGGVAWDFKQYNRRPGFWPGNSIRLDAPVSSLRFTLRFG